MTVSTRRGIAIRLIEDDPDAVDLKLPLATLTPLREESGVRAGHSLGADRSIRKRVDRDRCRAVIRQLGAYRLARNEAPPAPA